MAIAGSNEIYKKISSQIESQFPGFIREDGPQFVAFLKAYFEYMEQNGKAINAIRSIDDYRDIDRTLDSFVEYFRREFMPNIPKDTLADQRLLIKHIREFYRTRGTPESYRFLFRALFNKEVDFYYPGDDILRASDGRWLRESKLRVGDPKNINPTTFGGIKVTGTISGATAIVQGVVSLVSSGLVIYDMTVENVSGTFVDGEKIFDEEGNYATVTAQIGPITDFIIKDGGSRHNINDIITIGGAGSTVQGRAIVTRVSEATGITARIVKGGSGYQKKSTKVIVEGDGEDAEIVVSSFWPEPISTALNSDLIGDVKDVRLDSDFFVRKGANTVAVKTKLNGILKAKTSTNTVYGIGSAFTSQLDVGDVVRITGSPTALRVHSIGGAQTFVSTAVTAVNVRANGYSKFAAANISSTLETALTYSTEDFFMINAISIINPGKNYTTLPTITIVDEEISRLNVDDGHGGYLGRNAVVVANTTTGKIAELRILDRGSNFNKYSLASMYNTTQGNSSFVTSHAGYSANGTPATKYTIQKRTYSGSGIAQPSGVTVYPGKYVDTKGFLSWNNKLQDNFYYQEFSYVVRVTELLEKYRDVVRKLLHPSGTKLFADYQINATINTPIIVGSSQSNILSIGFNESVSATDSVVGYNTTSAGVTESVTTSVTFPTAEVTKNVGMEESISVSDIFDILVTFAATPGSESVTSTDTVEGVYSSVVLTSGTQSVTSTDTLVGRYVSDELTAGVQTISTDDTVVGRSSIPVSPDTESVVTSESVDATYSSGNLTIGTQSVTSTADVDATYVSDNLTAGTQSVTSDDSFSGSYVSSNLTAGPQSVTPTDTVDGGTILATVTAGTESVTPTDNSSAIVLLGAQLEDSVTPSDSVVGNQQIPVSVTENNGEITPYASTLISTYQSTQISEFVDPVLNLDDSVNRT